ncbi:MAG: flagellar motor switch protein FliN [Gemmatimonadaceae bacterium]|jgi:flagellar motor switch protein FliN/FliY|nr:flagellar motor switch protein FliN [Gemmatimonadaceae bacterium]
MNPAEIEALIAAKKAGMNLQDVAAPGAAATADAGMNDFGELDPGLAGGSEVPMGALLDLTLPISIELGRTSMTIQEILQLGRGSVVQLDRLAGEPIDIFVGDRRFAEGEVVVLGENFGVRVTRILARSAGPELLG